MRCVPYPIRTKLREPREEGARFQLDDEAEAKAIELASDPQFLEDFLCDCDNPPVFAKWLAFTCALNGEAAKEIGKVLEDEARMVVLHQRYRQFMDEEAA